MKIYFMSNICCRELKTLNFKQFLIKHNEANNKIVVLRIVLKPVVPIYLYFKIDHLSI